MNVIIEEGRGDERYVNERTENIEGLKEAVKSYTPEYVEESHQAHRAP
jgi:anaerobic selenocysteine-containing dehydrogenase